ncbi:shikimate dehydrogenase [Ichthyenterobacterium sp. W332]|uniref:Shikimate dehydrogenase n=1 Tax=Microcosmobacter mediterraneus TaxID=3075607 RepID=A0ABU2YNX0_9FLAO|nr:shikimate dehydrogenase [Ichthyenterobacterium sp. W332]MDT0559500.1 shikimate dehydrogenase [Ichthyenterobacterium sp. W332]
MDKKTEHITTKLGLLGKNISYSFSRAYFAEKFELENLPFVYENYDLKSLKKFDKVLKKETLLKGLNVTIPYKEDIIPYLDKISKTAKKIGAVNTIKFTKSGKLKGYNTDWYGFKKSLKPYLKTAHKKALILGTGGASKAIAFALKDLNISYSFVSRESSKNTDYTYADLNETIIKTHHIIINCTPLGTHPNINSCPDIPYDYLTKDHLIYDLIYNPEQTKFLQCAELKGATTINGLKMLELQAERSWKIWNLV